MSRLYIGRRWLLTILAISIVLTCVLAQNTSANATVVDIPPSPSSNGSEVNSTSFPDDPYLKYRPSFACSLPVQILMTGIVLTLTSVLFIHLIFTGQYHWPLAPVNYALQLSAVLTLLVSLIATLQVILTTSTKESRVWPYMLTYIAVDIPPLVDMDNVSTGDDEDSGWGTGELAAWLLMNATTSALIQITHIQFLTLLFPSGLERRLIFTLLGPLAILSAIMQLLPIHNLHDAKLASIASAVQNICNATLSLLFTAALLIWGLVVNRKKAWRTDGGTAAFGAGALMLALASTAITFIYIPHKDQYGWIPGLMWAVILWQSFLGWWWWVGAGMGVGEVDDLLRREEKKRERRVESLRRRKERQKKREEIWNNVVGKLGYEKRKDGAKGEGAVTDGECTSDESQRARSRGLRRRPRRSSESSAGTASAHETSPPPPAPNGFVSRVLSFRAGRVLYGWFLHLRHAHLTAAREQAAEQEERIQQVFGREVPDVQEGEVVGWGLGSFGIRQRGAEMREEEEMELDEVYEKDSGSEREGQSEPGEEEGWDKTRASDREVESGQQQRGTKSRRRWQGRMTVPDERPTIPEDISTRNTEEGLSGSEHGPSSVLYWGPLRRWRLQDSTVYS